MSDDWHSMLEWLSDEGTLDPDETWGRFEQMARESSHRDSLQQIISGAELLANRERFSVITGTATLMSWIEWSPRGATLCQNLARALGMVLAELNHDRPGTIAAATVFDLDSRGRLTQWCAAGKVAQLMLSGTPPFDQVEMLGRLCNLVMAALHELLRGLIREQRSHDLAAPQIEFLHALRRYADAAKQLDRAVGAVWFEEPLLLELNDWQA